VHGTAFLVFLFVHPILLYNSNMTDTWHFLSLGDGMTADESTEEVRGAFEELYKSVKSANDIAVFTRNESAGRLHCEVIAYFSPSASALAKAFDSEPCQRPERSGLELLIGNDQSWANLFPET
jgi:hypothetical protein